MTTNTRLGELEARVQECRVLCRFGSASEDCLIADLAAALLALYGMSGSVTDLEECIALYEEALDLRPAGHPRRAVTLGNLGLALWSFCTYHAQDETRLQRCVTSHREALALRPLGHDDHAISMSNLANALDTTHDQHGGHDLLREVIYLRREVLRVSPSGALNHDGALHNLGLTLHNSFSTDGGLERLAESIALLRQALKLRPPGHPSRHSSLNSLANALRANFEAQGDMSHLLEAVNLHREALQLYQPGHPHHIVSVNNLANTLQISYRHGRVVSVLEEAITLRREALRSCPPGHPSRGSALVNLAVTLRIRSEAQETSDTLTEALFLYRELLQICPPGHPGRHNALNSYATSLQAKFERHHDKADLENAVAQYREALEVCPVGHPDRAWIHSSVGRCLLYSNTPLFDFARGVEHMSQGLSENSATARDRFQRALVDLRRVESAYHSVMNELEESAGAVRSMDLLALYRQTIRLLPRVANFGLADHTARLDATAGSDEISRNAAARALNLGRTSEAVEMLEEGRGVFWSQALRLRASGLDGVPDEDRRELERLFHALQYGGGSSRTGDATAAGRERQLEERRLLNEQAEHLIAQLRTRPGLERFLMPPAFDRLIQSLPEGFVVVLISSALGYHALILNGGAGTAISLKLQPPHGGFLSPRVKSTLPRGLPAVESENKDADVLMESRGLFVSRRQQSGLESTLNDLWSSIVKPIINTLALKVSVASQCHTYSFLLSFNRRILCVTDRVCGGVSLATLRYCPSTPLASTVSPKSSAPPTTWCLPTSHPCQP
jgi:tetratricopeptide (TPR) repeat protein